MRELTEGGDVLPDAALCVVLASSGRCTLVPPGADGDEVLTLAAGDLALVGAGTAVTPGADSHILCAGLAGEAAQKAAQSVPRALRFDGRVCPGAAAALAALAAAEDAGADEERLAVCAFALLAAVARADEAPREGGMPVLVRRAVAAIEQNFAGLYGVEELSEQLGVSKSHLVRAFRAATGTTPGQYLAAVRIEAAKALLSLRDDSLELVASLCGFSGANYFCKAFKKHTGMTPAAWRAAHAGAAVPSPLLQRLERNMYV